MSRIFLSHSSTDNAHAIAMRDWLAQEGWDDVFLDLDADRGIVAGDRWERRLHEAANRCEAVIFLVSSAWLKSEWCLREFHLAEKLNKRIFSVVIGKLKKADLPADVTRTWQFVDLAQGQDHDLFRVMLPDGEESHVTCSRSGLARLRNGLTRSGLDPRFFAWPPEGDRDRPPYRGMRPMEAEDAGIFFGREAPTIEALDRLRGLSEAAPPRLFVILGASGAGKSSFLRAGLWPRLQRDDRFFLPLPIVRPERAVQSGETGLIQSIEQACRGRAVKRSRAEIRKALEAGVATAAQLLAELAQAAKPADSEAAPTLVLAVDQAEELFQAAGRAESEAFLRLLAGLAMAATPRCIIVFTIRSDAYEPLQTAKAFEGLTQVPFSLSPIPTGAWGAVIEGPARRMTRAGRKLAIEPALTHRLLADLEAGGGKDALPLLAFTLERLFTEYGGDGDLKLAEYEEFGGVSGAIDAAVKQAMAAADGDSRVPPDAEARKALLRRALIPWLSGIDPDTGSPRRFVARLSEIPEEARPLVEHLVNARLLSTDGDLATGNATIEPAHEALLRQWSLLNGWLVEDAGSLASLEAVRRATRDWLANNRDRAWLNHRASRLDDAERLHHRPDLAAKLDAEDREYLAACRESENAEREKARLVAEREIRSARRIRIAAIAASVLAVIAGVAAWWGNERRMDAVTFAASAIQNESLAFSTLSKTTSNPYDSAWYALASWPSINQPERPMLFNSLKSIAVAFPALRKRYELYDPNDPIKSVAFLGKGEHAITAKSSGKIEVWNNSDGQLFESKSVQTSKEGHIALSSNGRYAVATGDSGQAILVDLNERASHIALPAFFKFPDVQFSSQGRYLGNIDGEGGTHVIDAASGGAILDLPASGSKTCCFTFTDNEKLLTVDGPEGQITVMEMPSGSKKHVLESPDATMRSMSTSLDGKWLIATFDDNTARIWNLESGEPTITYAAHGDIPNKSVLSFNGQTAVTSSFDGELRVWDTETGDTIDVTKNSDHSVELVGVSRDDQLAAVRNKSDSASLLHLKSGTTFAEVHDHDQEILAVLFDPLSSTLATVDAQGRAVFWDAYPSAVESKSFASEYQLNVARVFGDDALVVTTVNGEIHLLDLQTTDEAFSIAGGEGAPEAFCPHFSLKSRRLYFATNDNAEVWNVDTKTKEFEFPAESDAYCLSVSPDENVLAVASVHGIVRLYDIATGLKVREFKAHNRSIKDLAFSPDGKLLAFASFDRTVTVWDAAGTTKLASLAGHSGTVNSLSFHPNSKLLVTASDDGQARVWNIPSGELQVSTARDMAPLNSVSFSGSGKQFVTGGSDGTARIWDSESAIELGIIHGHDGRVNDARFFADDRKIVTASSDGNVYTWSNPSLGLDDLMTETCRRLSVTTSPLQVSAGQNRNSSPCQSSPLIIDWNRLQVD